MELFSDLRAESLWKGQGKYSQKWEPWILKRELHSCFCCSDVNFDGFTRECFRSLSVAQNGLSNRFYSQSLAATLAAILQTLNQLKFQTNTGTRSVCRIPAQRSPLESFLHQQHFSGANEGTSPKPTKKKRDPPPMIKLYLGPQSGFPPHTHTRTHTRTHKHTHTHTHWSKPLA